MRLINLSQDKNSQNYYFSNTLIKEIESNLNKKKKVIIYLNKRGSYSSLLCNSCQHLYECPQCDVSLNVHNISQKLVCHLCWYEENLFSRCKQCNSEDLQKTWIWTQQAEEFLKHYFQWKNYNIFRFDTDVVKNKTEKSLALQNLENADIIIGTKMITTWFDFRNIGLIGVLLLEQELQIPWYDTKERVFGNIKQLLWRGSRLWETTDVIIQSFIPENEIVQHLAFHNYKDFFIHTLEERKLFNYPPFCEMVELEYRHSDRQKSFEFTKKLADKLKKLSIDQNIEIILNEKSFKRNNSYFFKIIIKGDNLHEFLKNIKSEIMRNSGLSVIFHS